MTKLFESLNSQPIIYLLQAVVFWLLWFGGVFTIRFVGSPPFLLILSGQAKYFFIPCKGTSNPPSPQPPPQKKPHPPTHTKTENPTTYLKKLKKLKEEKN